MRLKGKFQENMTFYEPTQLVAAKQGEDAKARLDVRRVGERECHSIDFGEVLRSGGLVLEVFPGAGE